MRRDQDGSGGASPDYRLTLTKLRILDALTGPLPEMPEDQQRERDREQLERAFPKIKP